MRPQWGRPVPWASRIPPTVAPLRHPRRAPCPSRRPPADDAPPPPQRAQSASAHHEDGGTDQPCLLERAHLHAVPSTLLIPLAARAHGGRYFAWLACQDAVATQLLAELGADINAYPDDMPSVL